MLLFYLTISCFSTGAGSPDTADHPLKVNGGFIAMAAGLSVIVPLICVLIIQLRRSKREERERVAAAAATAAEAGTTPTEDLPPSYEQLFGSTVNPVSDDDLHSSTDALNTSTDDVMHARSDSLAVLLEENEVRRPRAVSANAVMSASGTNVTSDGSYDNGGYAGTPLSTISGSSVLDLPLSTRPSSAGSSNDSQDVVDGSMDGFSTVSTDLSETNSLQSSSSLAPSTSSSDVPPPSPPPPPYRSPASSRHANNTNSSGIQHMLRRFPGMHVSIQELFSSFLSPQDNENDTPPPSYEEALKILEAASQSILGENSN